jgi:hypothetical protein
MASNKFTGGRSERSGITSGITSGTVNKKASNNMMQTLQEEKIFQPPNKWENIHVQSHGKKFRVGAPSRKLRKMHSRNIVFTVFDNLLFLPMYLLEQLRNQPKRLLVLSLIFVSFAVLGSSAEHLDAQTRYSTQLKNNVLQSFRYLKQHYLPHCC